MGQLYNYISGSNVMHPMPTQVAIDSVCESVLQSCYVLLSTSYCTAKITLFMRNCASGHMWSSSTACLLSSTESNVLSAARIINNYGIWEKCTHDSWMKYVNQAYSKHQFSSMLTLDFILFAICTWPSINMKPHQTYKPITSTSCKDYRYRSHCHGNGHLEARL